MLLRYYMHYICQGMRKHTKELRHKHYSSKHSIERLNMVAGQLNSNLKMYFIQGIEH